MKGVIKKDIKPIAKRPTQLLRMLRSIGLDYRKVKAELPRDADKAVVCSTSACLRHITYVGIMCRKRGETVRIARLRQSRETWKRDWKVRSGLLKPREVRLCCLQALSR